MIKKVLWSLLLMAMVLSAFVDASEQETLLIIKMKDEAILPEGFRTCKTPFSDKFKDLNRQGFEDLNISGSSQFSVKSLEKILETINWNQMFFVVDLRQECHGYINGNAVTWYTNRNWGNRDLSLRQIENKENDLIASVLKMKKINLYQITAEDKNATLMPEAIPILTDVKNAFTERKLAEHLNLQYFRIPVTDHMKPTDKDINRFVSFIKVLPKNVWIHFHCSGGIGRTTSFMAMFDMMRNAKILSFDEIIQRQIAIGGKDLADVVETKVTKAWKAPFAVERYEMLKQFYKYCRTNDDNFNTSWIEYLNEKLDQTP